MPHLLFLHDLDAAVAAHPAAVPDDLPAVPPFVLVTPGCGHPPICTLVVDAAAAALRLQCVVCGALVAVAVGDHTEDPAPAPHGEQRTVLYSEGRLAVYCAACVTPLACWDVAASVPA
jgi:ribosomal protein S27E